MAWTCYPDGNGGQVCNTGPEFFCPEGQTPVCTPGKPQTVGFCQCVQPAMCAATVVYQRDTPAQTVKIVPDGVQCGAEGLQIALAVALARMLMGP